MSDNSDSPCVRKCCLDGGLCTGCYRTQREIQAWGSMSEQDRIRVNLEATQRKKKSDD